MDNMNLSKISQPVMVNALLDLSQYNEKKKAESEQAREKYKTLVAELHDNFDKPTSLYGLESRIVDLLEFVSIEDLQKEFVFFNKMADDFEKKSELLKKKIETDFDKTKIQGDILRERERDKLIDDASSIINCQSQALKVAVIFGTAIKEKERQDEQERREIVGTKLRMIREMKGLNQADLAKMLGTTPSLIANYEAGRREPTIKNLIKLVKSLNISSDWLLDIPTPIYEK